MTQTEKNAVIRKNRTALTQLADKRQLMRFAMIIAADIKIASIIRNVKI